MLLLSFSFVSVTALKVEKKQSDNVIISEINNPVEFEITIDPEGRTENVEIFTYVGVYFEPNNISELSTNGTFKLMAFVPSSVTERTGDYRIEYIVSTETSVVKDVFRIEVIDAEDAIEISPISLEYGSRTANVIIRNKLNQSINDINFKVESLFFEDEFSINLNPNSEQTVSLSVNSDGINELTFGSYIADFIVNNTKSRIETNINYLEKEDSQISKESSGIVVRKVIYTRTNTGNVPISGEISVSKDVFSRLFTTTSEEADVVDRNALSADYSWTQNLEPGESFSVTISTNYTFPVILILLIIIIAMVVKIYVRTNLVIDKRVSFMKTKGGEFALKVRLHVKAKKYVENVQIVDRLPGMTQLYDKFGIKPDKIDSATRRLFWNVDRLNAGEERVYSYIIFSKVNVVGRFELPAASGVYMRDGKTEQTLSNRAFFVAETAS
jgi:hypothetical protein